MPVIASSFKLQFRHHHLFFSSSSPFLFRYTVTSLPPFSIYQSLPPFSFSPSCSWYSAQSLDLSSIPSPSSTQLLSTYLSQFSSLDLSTPLSLIHHQTLLQIVIYPLSNSRPPPLRRPLNVLCLRRSRFSISVSVPTRDVRRSGRTTQSFYTSHVDWHFLRYLPHTSSIFATAHWCSCFLSYFSTLIPRLVSYSFSLYIILCLRRSAMLPFSLCLSSFVFVVLVFTPLPLAPAFVCHSVFIPILASPWRRGGV